MTKELEALERLRNTLLAEGYWQDVLQDVSIIETALKDYEMEHTLRIRLENINYELVREKESNENKLKALEIIKSKEMLSVFKDIGSGKCYLAFNTTAIEIPQEEYEVLKEVLL